MTALMVQLVLRETLVLQAPLVLEVKAQLVHEVLLVQQERILKLTMNV